MYLPEKGYKRTVIFTFYIILGLLVAFLFLRYLLSCLLPFLAAFAIAYSTRKIVLFLCNKLKFTRFFAVLTITFIIIGLITFLIWLLLSRGFSELSGLSSHLTNKGFSSAISALSESFLSILQKISPELAETSRQQIIYFTKNIDILFSTIIERALPYIANTAIVILKAFPNVFLFLGVTLLSMFYFGCDYEKITSFIKMQLSEKQFKFFSTLKNEFFDTVFRVLKAYLILISITFAELWVGFSIIGVPYATLLALFTSFIDILPILGTGTVLLPFSLASFLLGNTTDGICIIALYIIVTVVRQIAEPKILGDSVGLHPLLTLISMYFGLKLAGVGGLLIFPFVVIIIKNLNEAGAIKLYKQK